MTPEHLLLGLIADHETVATTVLIGMGVNLNQLAATLVEEAAW